ncbi:hypothetical protein HNP46_000289 [Pseudomonas nitritireducens]|uniref:Uncharacterized protein n=1 Tax=Pseudomonas nitroreducens TaxID=46680 RepID=A0A7W7KFT2_PSENT|nr:hypothetical protein [Pseudomonas nitritireducens]MBB4861478.1 hypothetical protein [Pseudomonas nitritireducens]
MMISKRHAILRQIPCDSNLIHQVAERPVRVGIVLDEARIARTGELVHNQTIMIDERLHDWEWANGNFRWYSHFVGAGEAENVILVFELENREVCRTCGQTFLQEKSFHYHCEGCKPKAKT